MGDLEYRSVDLQNGDTPEASTIWFDIFSGFNEAAEARGDHLIIPQKPGQTEMLLVPNQLTIELRGFVRGIGSDRVEMQQSWREASDALRAIMDPSLPSATLEVQGPYMGLAEGVSRSLSAIVVDAIGGEILNRHSYQKWTIKLICISDPPDWVEVS